jgi:hypothetical protein
MHISKINLYHTTGANGIGRSSFQMKLGVPGSNPSLVQTCKAENPQIPNDGPRINVALKPTSRT